MNVITIDENKKDVERSFKSMNDLKKFLRHRQLDIRPTNDRLYKGIQSKAFHVYSYLKDASPRFNQLLVL